MGKNFDNLAKGHSAHSRTKRLKLHHRKLDHREFHLLNDKLTLETGKSYTGGKGG